MPDPYHVWLSEIMLQQTTVQTVTPYFLSFLKRWPTVKDLAGAAQDDVMHAWQGLGYYSRARNLLKCAKAVADTLGGTFPDTEKGLATLPGIGPYTAAAIAAIAFNRPAMPVDGNIERVTARLYAMTEPMPASKPAIRAQATALISPDRPGDMAQALMDLGATICTPRNPACHSCPLSPECRARSQGIAADLPARAPKKPKPTRHAAFFWLTATDGRVLFQRRPDKGMLGGMFMPPSTPWDGDKAWPETAVLRHAPAPVAWTELNGTVQHSFTHFDFRVTVWCGELTAGGDGESPVPDAIWCHPDQFAELALPTIAKKICAHALSGGQMI